MLEEIFALSGGAPDHFSRQYVHVAEREYFMGDLCVRTDHPIDFHMQKSVMFPMSIMRTVTNCPITYRRSLNHIRSDQSCSYILWIIIEGGLKVTTSPGTVVAGANSMMVVDPSIPSFSEFICGMGGNHESISVTIPHHLAMTYLGELSARPVLHDISRSAPWLRPILQCCSEYGLSMGPELNAAMSQALLLGLRDSLHGDTDSVLIASRHEDSLTNIKNFISKNLTRPDLRAEVVAAGCDMSVRHLHHLLKGDGTTFSSLLWGARLEAARSWLLRPELACRNIAEISRLAGFKSPAHFCRTFKTSFGSTPNAYRYKGRAGKAQDRPSARANASMLG